jgi:competence protein ComFC
VVPSALADALLRFFYPGACPGCLKPGDDDMLCPECARKVPLAGALQPPPALGGRPVLAACRYEGVARELILRLKFEGGTHPAAALGGILATALAAAGLARGADALVPMPLSRRRLRERGFNQAERIAAVVAPRLDLPLLELLRRPGHRRPQAELGPAERAWNVRGVFRAADGVFGRAILLLDDVITTGHTIAEAAAALEAAGARRVVLASVAASGWEIGAPGPSAPLRSGPAAPGTP